MTEQITIVLLIIVSIMMVLTFIGVGIIMRNIKDKPVIRCVKVSRPYKSVQRNGNFKLDEDYENWAGKLTLYNIDYPTMPDVNYKCPKCDSKILLGAETKKSGSFHCLKCGYTGDRDEFNGIDYHGADRLGLTDNDEEEEK